jgi:hypothetical protein
LVKFNVILTGVDAKFSSTRLSKIGIHLVEKPNLAQTIVAPKVLRTEKFLCALANAVNILKPVYLEDCLAAGELIHPIPDKYRLDFADKKLFNALQRARDIQQSGKPAIFDGITFNVAPGVSGGFDVFNRIVQSHGAHSSVLISSKNKKFTTSRNHRIILIATGSQQQQVQQFKQQSAKGDKVTRVAYSTDWVYKCILEMKLSFDAVYEL